MASNTIQSGALQVIQEMNRCSIVIPWKEVDQRRDQLLKEGYSSIICLEPALRQARLELHSGTDLTAALAILKGPGMKDDAIL